MNKEDIELRKIVPFIPVYARAPNKLTRYEERPFVCRAGHHGIERIGIISNKK